MSIRDFKSLVASSFSLFFSLLFFSAFIIFSLVVLLKSPVLVSLSDKDMLYPALFNSWSFFVTFLGVIPSSCNWKFNVFADGSIDVLISSCFKGIL